MARSLHRLRSVCLLVPVLGVMIWISPTWDSLRAEDAPPDPDPTRFASDIEAFEQGDRASPPEPSSILFLGSSSIKLWDLNVWFPEQTLLNRGFGGSQLSDVIHYADRLITPSRPRLVIVYAGDNDIAEGKSPERVLKDFLTLSSRIRTLSPNASIVFLSIKPSLARKDHWPSMRHANRLINEACDMSAHLHFLDVASPMLDALGAMRPELYDSDGLHLNNDGYAIWAERLAPVLQRFLDNSSAR
ncbi:GDSL-type esterase/lipase family protein [Tautonia rosea]|uniref:GDSL-type esterase/lipase family protein n=1 Tax=Tautonia rosea TaxID=2728037 RepID=UPI001472CF07|nr:GDSL-type esterase/lipase family protein [Tautonia rosea]